MVRKMKPVTDPNILNQLNLSDMKPVSDPTILAQLNKEQPQDNLSKMDMIKKGYKMIASKVKGNAEFKGENVTNFENWLWSQPKLGFNKANIKTSFAGMFGNDKDKVNSFFKNNPNRKKEFDSKGNVFFRDGNKIVYIDNPGLDAGDIIDTVGEGLSYTAGGLLAAPIKGAIKKTIAGGASQGGINVLNQKLAQRENVDLGEAGMATVGGSLFEAVPSIVNKFRNAKKGNLNISDDAKQAVDFADENNLPLYYDDVTKSGVVKKIGQQLDEIPLVGGVKTRQIQNQAQNKVAGDFTNKFKLPNSELDDMHSMVSDSAKKHLARSQKITTKKFNKAYERLNQSGEFDVPEVKKIAENLIETELKKGSSANQSLINEAKSYLDVGQGNFQHWGEIRSDLVAKVRDASKGMNEHIGTKTTAALKRISTVLNKSLDDVAEKTGGSQVWRDANNFYENAVIRYKKGVLKNAMKEENPEKMLNLITGIGKGTGTDSKHVANQIYGALDKNGKATIRHGMMQKAYSEALNETGAFSPAKYASMLERYENKIGVFLSKEDKHFVKGLGKYMRFTQNAGDYATNIKTGQKAVGTIYAMAAGASAMSNPIGTALGASGIVGLKKIFRTKRGRSLMLAMSTIPDGKKPPSTLIKEITRYLAVDQEY